MCVLDAIRGYIFNKQRSVFLLFRFLPLEFCVLWQLVFYEAWQLAQMLPYLLFPMERAHFVLGNLNS